MKSKSPMNGWWDNWEMNWIHWKSLKPDPQAQECALKSLSKNLLLIQKYRLLISDHLCLFCKKITAICQPGQREESHISVIAKTSEIKICNIVSISAFSFNTLWAFQSTSYCTHLNINMNKIKNQHLKQLGSEATQRLTTHKKLINKIRTRTQQFKIKDSPELNQSFRFYFDSMC